VYTQGPSLRDTQYVLGTYVIMYIGKERIKSSQQPSSKLSQEASAKPSQKSSAKFSQKPSAKPSQKPYYIIC